MIVLQDVYAGYDGNEILHHVSFSLQRGENLSIIGPNGCGKTTLLRVIAGILPFSGKVILDGLPVQHMKPKALAKKVSMLSQITQLYFNYTVFETVMMGRYVHGGGGVFATISQKDKEVVVRALETVGILGLRDRAVDTLSGGQLQRVFLAKVLAQDPDIILLDEPTNHLDMHYQIELVGFLRNWSKTEGKTVIGVLHDLNLAMILADTILLLDNGSVTAYGDIQTVYASESINDVFQMDVAGYMRNTLRKWETLAYRKTT